MYETNTEDIIKAQRKSEEAMEKIITNNSGLVWSIVNRFLGRGYSKEELYQIGCIGLIKAVQRFDTKFEVKISTFAVPYIMGEIKRFIRDDGPIKVSRSIKELGAKIREIQRDYLAKNGKDIKISEIAKILSTSVEDVAVALDASRPLDSIDEELYEGEDKQSKISKISNNKDEMGELINKITVRKLIKELEKREQEIILLRYYKQKTQVEVAKALRNITSASLKNREEDFIRNAQENCDLGRKMKKIIILILAFVLICFMLPILFTKKYNPQEITTAIQKEEDEYDYKQYSTIKLLHTETGEIEEINIDEYLYGVVAAEMPASFHEEALKAQALVARTYTIYKIINGSKHEGADICDSASCCQAWISKENRFARWNEEECESNWKKIVSAVENTKGKIITYEGNPINAFFHSNSGGTTETASNVWGGTNYPYLQTVETVGEDAYSQYNSEVTLTKNEVIQKLKEYHSDIEMNFENENEIQILENTESGRVKTIKFGNIQITGTETRTIFGLRSANFTVKIEGDNVIFEVLGYGHGVGMSQTGADSMAKLGNDYETIIKHYYTGVEIQNIF